MVNEIQYTSIKTILDRLLRHPLLQDLDLETAIQHTVDFISIVGLPKFYQNKEVELEVKDYRAVMPCDLVAINMVKHKNRALRHMTDVFNPTGHCNSSYEESFKTQHNIIYTSFKEGLIQVSYKAIPVDCNGWPLLIDNSNFLKALEEYIKLEHFTILFDCGKLNVAQLQNQQIRYGQRVSQVQSEFVIPSVSEMESITRMFNTLIPRQIEFDNGFKNLGNREYIKAQ